VSDKLYEALIKYDLSTTGC